MQQDEQAFQSVLRPPHDTSSLYGQRVAALQALLQLAVRAIDEHSAKQAVNVSSYSYPNDMGRAIASAAELCRALGVQQGLIDKAAAEGRRTVTD